MLNPEDTEVNRAFVYENVWLKTHQYEGLGVCCMLCMYVQANGSSGSNKQVRKESTTLNCYNMRSEEEPTVLLAGIKHLVDHICWKRSQKSDFQAN